MELKTDIETRAKALIETSPQEAIILYEQLWNDYNEQFNAWDALFLMKALRKQIPYNSEIVHKVAEKFHDAEMTMNVYSWYIIDKYIKHIEANGIIKNESVIRNSLKLFKQKDLSVKKEFPCPFTILVFELVDAHSTNLFNAKKIIELLDYLNPAFLSVKCDTIKTDKNEDKELASDKEKYYALKSKALCKLDRFIECIDICDTALSLFAKFHYDNDTWLLMRKAICFEKLGNIEESEKLFQEILATKAGSDKWFLFKDLADFYFEQQNYEKAWKYSVDSAYYGNEPEFMVNLYLLQARILYKLNRPEEGRILANLLASIYTELKRHAKPEFQQLFRYYGTSFDNVPSIKENFAVARKFWLSERYKGKERKSGEIINIHISGRRGKIKSDNRIMVSFARKDLRVKIKDLTPLVGAKVEYYLMTDFKDDNVAEDIVIISSPKVERSDSDVVGKIFQGKVKSIMEYGIFISLPEMKDGLLHRSALPKEFKDNFKEHFSVGDIVKVEVTEFNDKRISLKYIK
jgi:hypothetical protein